MLYQQGSSTDLLSEIRKEGVLNVLSVYCPLRQNYSKFRPIIYDKTAVASILKNVFVYQYYFAQAGLSGRYLLKFIRIQLPLSSRYNQKYKSTNSSKMQKYFRPNIRRRTREGSNWPSKVCSNRITIRTCIMRKTLPWALRQNIIFWKYRAIHFSWSLPAYYTRNDIRNDGGVPSEQAQDNITWGHSKEFNKKIPRDNLKLAKSDAVHYFRSYLCRKTCIFAFVVYRCCKEHPVEG
jgi:hypothetical protein